MQQFWTSEPFIHGSLAIWMAIKSNQLSTSHVVEPHHQLMLSLAKLQITSNNYNIHVPSIPKPETW